MGVYTVESVDPDTHTWSTRDGSRSFVAYKLEIAGDAKGLVELSKLPTSEPPRVGDRLEGYELINTAGRPPRLKKEPGSAPQRVGGNSYKRDPGESAQIVRQHSQEMALRLLALEIQLGTVPKDARASELLTPRIDWFQKDAENAEPSS